ncbi:MAG TPA: hypothetical protein VD999_05855 [Vitreimonas sp.]|nr:hypothetical protein [Vitreimonas sp.]
MVTLEHAIEGVLRQGQNRRAWQEGDTVEEVYKMLENELKELWGGLMESFVTGDVWPVASEVGDILFLLIRFCELCGLEPADVLDMKTKRNAKKYDDAICNDGYLPEQVPGVAKQSWKAMGGDYMFSNIYLDYLAHAD